MLRMNMGTVKEKYGMISAVLPSFKSARCLSRAVNGVMELFSLES